jgi:pilus assembly protein Flp/PilA
MNDLMIKLYVTLKSVMAREEGQDLVEYALVVALIALGAIAGMTALAGGINQAFSTVATKLTSDVA